jgi:hypothetical protein
MDDNGYPDDGKYDMIMPSHVGNGNFALGGNDGTWFGGLGNSWFDWYEWIRITAWARAAATNPSVNNGDGFFQTLSQSHGPGGLDLSDRPTFPGGTTEKFNQLNVPGWYRERGGSTVRPHYDDLYLATGPGAAARVEIGNQSEYRNCTNLSMSLVRSWSASEIQVELRTNNDFDTLEGAWLFIHDADNNLVGSPRPITRAP